MNKVKISIKADGVKVKTSDVTLALQVLERLDNQRSLPSLLKNFFGCECEPEDDDDFKIKVTKLALTPEGLIPEEETPTIKRKATRSGPYKGTYQTKKRVSKKKTIGLRTWTEPEDLEIVRGINNGLTNTEISNSNFLLARHTKNSVMTRVSGIRHADTKRVSKSAINLAKELIA